jgi:protease I
VDHHRGQIASWPSLKTDLRNAGAEWVDQEVVVGGNLVSSRKPDDIPAFNRAMIDLFGQAHRQTRRTAYGWGQAWNGADSVPRSARSR